MYLIFYFDIKIAEYEQIMTGMHFCTSTQSVYTHISAQMDPNSSHYLKKYRMCRQLELANLIHLSQMEFPILTCINRTSPFPLKGCVVVFLISI